MRNSALIVFMPLITLILFSLRWYISITVYVGTTYLRRTTLLEFIIHNHICKIELSFKNVYQGKKKSISGIYLMTCIS